MEDRRDSLVAIGLLAAALFVPGVCSPLLPSICRAALVALGLFYLPGFLLARALGLSPVAVSIESVALAFVLSLAVVVPAAAIAFVLGAGAMWAAVLFFLVSAGALLSLGSAHAPGADASREARAAEEVAQFEDALLGILVLVVAAAITMGALTWTATGSVDRWWYLGYVRAWSEGPFASVEPFLGTDHVHPRFAFSSWLAALAMWAHLARVDPVWLYERIAPAFLIPTAFAAQLCLGRALYGSRRGALLTALCAGLLWAGGGPVAVLSRVPEDKVLASIVIAPLLWAAAIRALSGGARIWMWAAAASALVLCSVHPLTFVLATLPVAAFAALSAWRTPARRARAAALGAVLVVTSVYPIATGVLARNEYVGEGVAGLAADHPIARVHRARDRLIAARGSGYIVDPRLLSHPIAILGLFGLVMLPWRPSRERQFLAPAAVLPLAIAFVPPLAAAAGTAILPWMVHRVLWTLPLGALAAVAADEIARRLGGRTAIVATALMLASLPPAARAMEARSRAERIGVAVPDDARLRAAFAAVRRLPRHAVVAAAPELSERLPALTGRRVLAMSDRATIAFVGSRDVAEARLRARAALFGGVWKPAAEVPMPTHVLYAPGSKVSRYCAEELFANDGFALCSFRAQPPPLGTRLPAAEPAADGGGRVALAEALVRDATSFTVDAECDQAPRMAGRALVWARPGPWSAAFTAASCEFSDASGGFVARTLVLRPLLGRAVEELTIQAVGEHGGAPRWRVRTRVRAHDGDILRFALPRALVSRVRIEIVPSFLPFLKLDALELTFEEGARGAS